MSQIEDVVKEHKELIRQIHIQDYYLSVFSVILKQYNLTEEELGQLTNLSDIINFWNDFWFLLPDTAAIRRFPFFDICKMCEYDVTE